MKHLSVNPIHIITLPSLTLHHFTLFPLTLHRHREEVAIQKNSKKQRLEKGIEHGKTAEKDENEDVTFIVPFSRCLETFFCEEIVEYPNPSLAPLKTGPAKHTTLIGKYVRDTYTVYVCVRVVCTV
jgi:hypothetical protein